MNKFKRKISGIKVMADFTSSGMWDMKTGVMIGNYPNNSCGLKFPKDLCDELDKWMIYYENCFDKDYGKIKSAEKAKKLNEWGMELAKKIKKVHPSIKVVYVGEDEKNYSLPPVEIKF